MCTTLKLLLLLLFVLCIGKKLIQHWISFENWWYLREGGGFNGLFLVTLVIVAAVATVTAAAAAAAAIVALFLAAFRTTFSYLVGWFCCQGYLSFVVGHVWVIQCKGDFIGAFVNDESIVGHASLFFCFE